MNRAFVYMMVGATLWGPISMFVKNLYAYEFTPIEVVTNRTITASIILVSYLLISSPKSLKLKQIKDLKYFVRTGIFSKFALTKYTTLTVTTYTFVIASIVLLRSEEHTSELQSRGQLVCRLLLEKKKRLYTNT